MALTKILAKRAHPRDDGKHKLNWGTQTLTLTQLIEKTKKSAQTSRIELNIKQAHYALTQKGNQSPQRATT